MQKRHVFVILVAIVGVAIYHLEPERSADDPSADVADDAPQIAQADRSAASAERASSEEDDLETPLADKPLAARIPPEEQAYFLELDEDGEFLRMLRPGDRVDLMSVVDRDRHPELFSEQVGDAPRRPGAVPKALVETLLQNVVVLDVYARPEDGQNGAVLALALTADELNLVDLFSKEGELEVLARHDGDDRIHPIKRKTFRRALEDVEVLQKKRDDRRRVGPPKTRQEGCVVEKIERGDVGPHVECSGALTSRIPQGAGKDHRLRAVYVDARVPAGTVECGDRVNVFGTFEVDVQQGVGGEQQPPDRLSMTLLQDVSVLEVFGDDSIEGMVLSLSTDEAALLQLAYNRGDVWFALRHPEDPITGKVRRESFLRVMRDVQPKRRGRIHDKSDIEIIIRRDK